MRELVDAYGSDSLSFFALRRDKSYHFSPSRQCVPRVSRRRGRRVDQRRSRSARRASSTGCSREFQGVAHAHGWRLAVVGALGENLPRYERLGMRAIAIGDEAVLVPAEFSLEGRSIRKVRQSVSRLTKAGYRFRVVDADDIDPELRAQLDAVSETWRGNQAERGFSMAMDDLYAPGTTFAIAESDDGRGRRLPAPCALACGRRLVALARCGGGPARRTA